MRAYTLPQRRIHVLLISLGILAAVILLYILFFNGIGIPCLFRKLTGLLCPGCGNSRAAMALLRLDLRSALGHNLLFPLELLYLGWVYFFCCRQYLHGKGFSYRPPCVAVDIAVLLLLLLWWIVRNL